MKSVLKIPPMYHRRNDTALGDASSIILALLLLHELDRRMEARGFFTSELESVRTWTLLKKSTSNAPAVMSSSVGSREERRKRR